VSKYPENRPEDRKGAHGNERLGNHFLQQRVADSRIDHRIREIGSHFTGGDDGDLFRQAFERLGDVTGVGACLELEFFERLSMPIEDPQVAERMVGRFEELRVDPIRMQSVEILLLEENPLDVGQVSGEGFGTLRSEKLEDLSVAGVGELTVSPPDRVEDLGRFDMRHAPLLRGTSRAPERAGRL
jgi:hypothetical protein